MNVGYTHEQYGARLEELMLQRKGSWTNQPLLRKREKCNPFYRCPKCGDGSMIVPWFIMECLRCGFKERIDT
jgi:hypothetical protein